ncbi:MAG: aminomethyl transferase family protein [Verrucomicrobia bacterium]|nr:aminomethyl transferase family protein [Verrucomicrobiota bacterium]
MNESLTLLLHEFHQKLGARFAALHGAEVVADFGDMLAEHAALRESAGVIDLSFRSRLCLLGTDRVRFLHGQVTNDVKNLTAGEGCYAALVTAKGKMESDLNVYALQDELLLDFEPGLTAKVSQRLEKFIVADDVQVVDVSPHYGLLSVQGPKAEAVVRGLGLFAEVPSKPLQFIKHSGQSLGEVYLMNQPRLGSVGFDLFVPTTALVEMAEKLITTARANSGQPCGWSAFDTARIEAGIPRFGADMDETNLPLECGIETRAVSYRKGCYIGQEVLNRIHTIGHVNRELRGLRLADDLQALPVKGDKLFHASREVGSVTSAILSPTLKANLALGYVRREANAIGTELTLQSVHGESRALIVELPFVK